MSYRQEESAGLACGLGGIGAVAVAGAMVGLCEQISNASVALELVVVVVLAAALGGRGPGRCTAVVAALSFDFFHTEPFLSLTISSRDDAETAGLLLVVGPIVGHIASPSRLGRAAATIADLVGAAIGQPRTGPVPGDSSTKGAPRA